MLIQSSIERRFPLINQLRLFIFAEILLSLTTQNNDVLSAKSFTVDSKLFEKPLIYIGTKKWSKDGAL